MGPSRPRSRSSNWSSDRCLAVPNFLCYGNACSMLLDRYRAFTRSLSSSVCTLYFSSRLTSRQFNHVRFILSFWLSVAMRITEKVCRILLKVLPYVAKYNRRACEARRETERSPTFLLMPVRFLLSSIALQSLLRAFRYRSKTFGRKRQDFPVNGK